MFCSTPLYQEPAGSLSLACATQVHAAGRRGLRLILPLMNYGSSGGGVAQYHKWAAHRAGSRITADYAALWSSDEGSECPLFYSDPASQEMYRYMAHKASLIYRPAPHPSHVQRRSTPPAAEYVAKACARAYCTPCRDTLVLCYCRGAPCCAEHHGYFVCLAGAHACQHLHTDGV